MLNRSRFNRTRFDGPTLVVVAAIVRTPDPRWATVAPVGVVARFATAARGGPDPGRAGVARNAPDPRRATATIG